MVGNARGRCTGTLLARDLVLTAAHCVSSGGEYKILKTDADRRRTIHTADQIERHPRFEPDPMNNKRPRVDLALIKLGGTLPDVPAPNFVVGVRGVRSGEEISIAGFGVNASNGPPSSGTPLMAKLVARQASSPSTSQDYIWLYDPVADRNAGGLGGCSGDSGAPAFVMRGSTIVIVGVVVSHGSLPTSPGCGGDTFAIAVAPHLVWLTETAHKLGTSLP